MMKWPAIITALMIIAPSASWSQNYHEPAEIISEMLVNAAESDSDDDLARALINSEYLETISNQKININTNNDAQLRRLPFMSDYHIDDIRRYRNTYGDFTSMGELKSIGSLSRSGTIRYLPYFVSTDTAGQQRIPSIREMIHNGTHSITTTLKTTIEKQQGYTDAYGNPARYQGNPMAWCVKYRYAGSHLAWGITMEKDAGESLGVQTAKYGFDFNSIYLKIEDMGKVEKAIVGDYTAHFGQGLILGGGFGLGKFVAGASFANTENHIHEYGSCNENAFYRGAAATVRLGNTRITAFGSQNLKDANTDGQSFYSIRTDGYHRTERELSSKDNLRQADAGAIITHSIGRLSLGAAAHYYNFDKQYIPKDEARNINRRSEKDGLSLSTSYKYYGRHFCLHGETAIDKMRNLATINILDMLPTENLKISLLQRHYSPEYQVFGAEAFGQGSGVCNEDGIYTGIRTQPASWLVVDGWVDFFRFGWLTSQSNEPSEGKEYLLQAKIKPFRNYAITIKYKEKNREVSADKDNIKTNGYLKLSQDIEPGRQWKLNTTAQWSRYSDIDGSEYGYMVFQNVQFRHEKGKYSFAARYALFSAPYNARIYSYENDVSYFFTVPGYYYTGSRYYLVAGCKILKKIDIQCRIAQWHYFDRQKISSGPQQINGSHKTELNVYLKYRI